MKGIVFTVSIFWILGGCNKHSEIQYFGHVPPGDSAIVFAPGIISIEGRKERSFMISPAGDEIFFCQAGFPNSKIYHMIKTEAGWSTPELAEFVKDDWATEPALSPDGKTLYFSSSREKVDIRDYHLWRVTKGVDGWSEPESLFDIEGSDIWEFHPSVTNDGALYFCCWDPSVQKGFIYYATPEGEITKLENPFHTPHVDPYIAPDESCLITKSIQPEGFGGNDLYISYKKKDGNWSNPRNMGPTINTILNDDVGDISPDGKYMFFTKNNDIYWISTKEFFSLF